jgi:hypothetical protein
MLLLPYKFNQLNMKNMPSFTRFSFTAAAMAACFSLVAQTGVALRPKVFLQGALHGLMPTATLMRDDLRAQGLLPLSEPYTGLVNFQHKGGGGGETITDPAVLQVTGANAIVDWVVVELRSSATSLSALIATRSALLQRDGDVVGMDGTSAVQFQNLNAGQYHVAIRHRNHLSILTQNKVALSQTPVTVDFADPSTVVCDAGQKIIGAKAAMWGGDCNNDGKVIYQGPVNDRAILLLRGILGSSAVGNTALAANFINKGYSVYDVNMDGKVKYQGEGNDPAMFFQNIMLYPPNNGMFISNYIITDCLPE